ncbi:hypothetical protein [Pseudomonas sp.]|uniref:hypothetical protein n=1 Tax=Pseudomonas sp. TaxID=306 RepID=UPI002614444F|nr:hypothetical protein [Pseudomonas sp.]
MIVVNYRGTNYNVPEPSNSWTQSLTNLLVSLATTAISAGLTSDADFGVLFGVASIYFRSKSANPATAGVVRLAATDQIDWRNQANNANLPLGIDVGNALTFNGVNVTGKPALGANTAAGQSIPNSTTTRVVFGTVEYDTDTAYNSATGVYTVPTGKAGRYLVSGQIAYGAALTTTSQLQIFQGGVLVKRTAVVNPGASQGLAISAVLNCAAGDTLDLRVSQASGGAATLLNTAAFNFFNVQGVPS